MAANGAMSLGSSAVDTRVTSAASAMLIHQRERSRIANRELWAILNFTGRIFRGKRR